MLKVNLYLKQLLEQFSFIVKKKIIIISLILENNKIAFKFTNDLSSGANILRILSINKRPFHFFHLFYNEKQNSNQLKIIIKRLCFLPSFKQ